MLASNLHKNSIKTKILVCFFIAFVDYFGMGLAFTLFAPILLKTNTFNIAGSYEERLILLGWLLATYPLGQLFSATLIGHISDLFGRKNILFITLTGTLCSFMLTGLSITIHSITLIFISRLIAGLFAGNIVISISSVVDISPQDKKVANVSFVQGGIALGIITGPIVGAYFSKDSFLHWTTYSTPFYIATLLTIIAIVVLKCCFSDAQTNKSKTPTLINCFFIKSIFMQADLRFLYLVFFLYMLGWTYFQQFLSAYLVKTFEFTHVMIGNFYFFFGLTYAIMQFSLVPKLSKLFKPDTLAIFSQIITGLIMLTLAFTTKINAFYIILFFYIIINSGCGPNLVATLSNKAAPEKQGEVIGRIITLQSLATLITTAFGATIMTIKTNSPFVIGGGLAILAGAMLLIHHQYKLFK